VIAPSFRADRVVRNRSARVPITDAEETNMRTMMMTLAILISACGVDDPKAPTRLHALPGQMQTTGDTAAAEAGANEPQPCEFTTDCEVGMCDLVTKTCFGDEPIDKHPHGDAP
jgi:hypothetical protein